MLKYEFEVDTAQNSSTGKILSKIKRGARVLEFGCAAGRMTRYMKEMLGCRVYIVECQRESYEKALVYAEDGVCGDLLQFQWEKQWENEKFDAIIFVDVLEHLSAPELALEHAARFLETDGCIYVSVPNVTHNDVVIKAISEHFDYTSTGILDDSHVHFWGMENLKPLAERAGLFIRELEATYRPIGTTEQFCKNKGEIPILLWNRLRQRQCGEVYQFIVTFCREQVKMVKNIRVPSVKSHIYLNTGTCYNEKEVIEIDAEYLENDCYRVHYVLEDTENVCGIRFDPIEDQGCVLKQISVMQAEHVCDLRYSNAVPIKDGTLLLGEDPAVYTEDLSEGVPVVVDAEFMIWGESYIRTAEDTIAAQKAELETAHIEHEALYRRLCDYETLVQLKDRDAVDLERELHYYQQLKAVRGYLRLKNLWEKIKRKIREH